MSNDLFKKYKDKEIFENPASFEECYKNFDKDGYVACVPDLKFKKIK